MKLTRFIQFMIFLTSISLIYIHLQMQIFDLAYQGKKKEKQIVELKDENGRIHYNIMSLKSTSYLGLKLLSQEKNKLEFLDKNDVVQLVTNEGILPDSSLMAQKISEKPSNFLLSLFSLKSQAEAKQIDKR